MAHGEFKIARQAGSRGYFGKVSLEAELVGGSVQVDFDDAHASRWQSAARFGIDYVLEHIPKQKYFPNGIRVHVACIEGHEVDTDSALIAYVTANAMFQALGIANPKKRPDLNEETGLVAFPK